VFVSHLQVQINFLIYNNKDAVRRQNLYYSKYNSSYIPYFGCTKQPPSSRMYQKM